MNTASPPTTRHSAKNLKTKPTTLSKALSSKLKTSTSTLKKPTASTTTRLAAATSATAATSAASSAHTTTSSASSTSSTSSRLTIDVDVDATSSPPSPTYSQALSSSSRRSSTGSVIPNSQLASVAASVSVSRPALLPTPAMPTTASLPATYAYVLTSSTADFNHVRLDLEAAVPGHSITIRQYFPRSSPNHPVALWERNPTFLLKTSLPDLESRLSTFAFNYSKSDSTTLPEIGKFSISKLPPRSAPISRPTKPTTWSVMLRNYSLDWVTDLAYTNLKSLNLSFTYCNRVTSRKTNLPTPLLRVRTTDPQTISYLLQNGLFIKEKNQTLPAEMAHLPPPNTLQCPSCFQFGHSKQECRSSSVACGICASPNHPTAQCNSRSSPKCLLCNLPHPSFAFKCPARAKADPKLPKAPFRPVPAIPIPTIPTPAPTAAPASSLSPSNSTSSPLPSPAHLLPVSRHELVYLLTAALMDLHPTLRTQIHQSLAHNVSSLWGLKTHTLISGNQLLVSFSPL